MWGILLGAAAAAYLIFTGAAETQGEMITAGLGGLGFGLTWWFCQHHGRATRQLDGCTSILCRFDEKRQVPEIPKSERHEGVIDGSLNEDEEDADRAALDDLRRRERPLPPRPLIPIHARSHSGHPVRRPEYDFLAPPPREETKVERPVPNSRRR
jgi:hypothetical protein